MNRFLFRNVPLIMSHFDEIKPSSVTVNPNKNTKPPTPYILVTSDKKKITIHVSEKMSSLRTG